MSKSEQTARTASVPPVVESTNEQSSAPKFRKALILPNVNEAYFVRDKTPSPTFFQGPPRFIFYKDGSEFKTHRVKPEDFGRADTELLSPSSSPPPPIVAPKDHEKVENSQNRGPEIVFPDRYAIERFAIQQQALQRSQEAALNIVFPERFAIERHAIQQQASQRSQEAASNIVFPERFAIERHALLQQALKRSQKTAIERNAIEQQALQRSQKAALNVEFPERFAIERYVRQQQTIERSQEAALNIVFPERFAIERVAQRDPDWTTAQSRSPIITEQAFNMPKPIIEQDEHMYKSQKAIRAGMTISDAVFKSLLHNVDKFVQAHSVECENLPRVWSQPQWKDLTNEFLEEEKFGQLVWEIPRAGYTSADDCLVWPSNKTDIQFLTFCLLRLQAEKCSKRSRKRRVEQTGSDKVNSPDTPSRRPSKQAKVKSSPSPNTDVETSGANIDQTTGSNPPAAVHPDDIPMNSTTGHCNLVDPNSALPTGWPGPLPDRYLAPSPTGGISSYSSFDQSYPSAAHIQSQSNTQANLEFSGFESYPYASGSRSGLVESENLLNSNNAACVVDPSASGQPCDVGAHNQVVYGESADQSNQANYERIIDMEAIYKETDALSQLYISSGLTPRATSGQARASLESYQSRYSTGSPSVGGSGRSRLPYRSPIVPNHIGSANRFGHPRHADDSGSEADTVKCVDYDSMRGNRSLPSGSSHSKLSEALVQDCPTQLSDLHEAYKPSRVAQAHGRRLDQSNPASSQTYPIQNYAKSTASDSAYVSGPGNAGYWMRIEEQGPRHVKPLEPSPIELTLAHLDPYRGVNPNDVPSPEIVRHTPWIDFSRNPLVDQSSNIPTFCIVPPADEPVYSTAPGDNAYHSSYADTSSIFGSLDNSHLAGMADFLGGGQYFGDPNSTYQTQFPGN